MMHHLLTYLVLLCLVVSCDSSDTYSTAINPDPSITSSHPTRDLPSIKKQDTLVALTGYNSISYFIYRGKPMGYELELLERLADDLGVVLKIKIIKDLSRVDQLLKDGVGDIVAHNLTITGDRKDLMDFTIPMNTTQQVLVQRKPKGWKNLRQHEIDRKVIRTPLGLSGKTIEIRENSSYETRLENLREETGQDFTIKIASGSTSTEYLIKKVALGEIDYTVADENIAEISTAFFPNIDIKTPISLQQQIAWAVRKDAPELKKAVNSWLRKMQRGSDYYVIYNRYFKQKRSVARKVKSPLYSRNSGTISEYDPLIKQHSAEIDWDWRLVASLIYQESKFDPEAKSWAGAKGLMQMMPETASQFKVANLYNPEQSIDAGTEYLSDLEEFWSERITDKTERTKFVMASYNTGPGHVLDAQRLAKKYGKDPLLWKDNVADYLRKKSKPEFYNDPASRHGYCRGEEPFRYVRQILNRYSHYKKFAKPFVVSDELAMN